MSAGLPMGRRGRVVALGVTAFMALVLWLGVLQPLLVWHGDLTQAALNRGAVLQRMAGLLETLPDLRRQAEAAGEAPAAAALLAGATDALAGAALQTRVRELAAQFEASLTSTETLPAEAAGGFRRIAVRFSTTVAWPVLVRLLDGLGQASPRMLVDDVQLRAGTTVVGGSGIVPLNVTLTVFAFRSAAP